MDKDWKEGFCPHQYYRHPDKSTDCPACAREAKEKRGDS